MLPGLELLWTAAVSSRPQCRPTREFTHPNDHGATWTVSIGGEVQWDDVASDSTGQYLVVLAAYEGIYRSGDYGATWAKYAAEETLNAVTCESICRNVTVVDWRRQATSTSSDYGASWTQTAAPELGWLSIAADSTGQFLIAGTDDAGIYSSDDYGVTWAKTNAPDSIGANWYVASDSSGRNLVAGSSSIGIYTSQATVSPTAHPTAMPSQPTSQPSGKPSARPSAVPTAVPSVGPSMQPSRQPTSQPTHKPTSQPSTQPSSQPSCSPTAAPSAVPTVIQYPTKTRLSFECSVEISGTDKTAFNSDSAAQQALRYTTAMCMQNVSADQVHMANFTDVTVRRLSIADSNVGTHANAHTQATGILVTMGIEVILEALGLTAADSEALYTALTDRAAHAVSTGDFNIALADLLVELGSSTTLAVNPASFESYDYTLLVVATPRPHPRPLLSNRATNRHLRQVQRHSGFPNWHHHRGCRWSCSLAHACGRWHMVCGA